MLDPHRGPRVAWLSRLVREVASRSALGKLPSWGVCPVRLIVTSGPATDAPDEGSGPVHRDRSRLQQLARTLAWFARIGRRWRGSTAGAAGSRPAPQTAEFVRVGRDAEAPFVLPLSNRFIGSAETKPTGRPLDKAWKLTH